MTASTPPKPSPDLAAILSIDPAKITAALNRAKEEEGKLPPAELERRRQEHQDLTNAELGKQHMMDQAPQGSKDKPDPEQVAREKMKADEQSRHDFAAAVQAAMDQQAGLSANPTLHTLVAGLREHNVLAPENKEYDGSKPLTGTAGKDPSAISIV